MRKTITKVVLIICAVSVALGIALCASGVVMGADVEKALRGIGINVETRIEPNNMYDDFCLVVLQKGKNGDRHRRGTFQAG